MGVNKFHRNLTKRLINADQLWVDVLTDDEKQNLKSQIIKVIKKGTDKFYAIQKKTDIHEDLLDSLLLELIIERKIKLQLLKVDYETHRLFEGETAVDRYSYFSSEKLEAAVYKEIINPNKLKRAELFSMETRRYILIENEK